jgi:hypothetical protein
MSRGNITGPGIIGFFVRDIKCLNANCSWPESNIPEYPTTVQAWHCSRHSGDNRQGEATLQGKGQKGPLSNDKITSIVSVTT